MSSKTKQNKSKILDATLSAAVTVLDVTGTFLDNTPIPGAAAVIKVVLDIIKQKEVRAFRNESAHV